MINKLKHFIIASYNSLCGFPNQVSVNGLPLKGERYFMYNLINLYFLGKNLMPSCLVSNWNYNALRNCDFVSWVFVTT